MAITINREPNSRMLELGGGASPLVRPECQGGNDVHVDVRICQDAQGRQTVDFAHDLSLFPWPLGDGEFDGAIAIFVLEHLPYPAVPDFIEELHRVLKSGAKAVVAIPNTEAQMKWALEHPEGWDGKDLFLAASEKLFGDQRHSEREGDSQPGSDSHKSFFSPAIATQLFQDAGFSPVVVRPYGERATDLLVEAVKEPSKTTQEGRTGEKGGDSLSEGGSPLLEAASPLETEARNPEILYGRDYWENYRGEGFAWDFPRNEVLFKSIMRRKPESVLELGCGRGYLLQRFQDAGIRAAGYEISKTAIQTRVCEKVYAANLLVPWPDGYRDWMGDVQLPVDLCLSVAFLEHVPEHLVPQVAGEMKRTCKRGLHAVHFQDDGKQQGACTFRDRNWWQERLPPGHEVVSWQELIGGEFPPDVLKGDGKVKANLGCAWTMRHHGWENVDILDLKQFAQANGYKFKQWDLRQGLPWKTGEVDLIFMSHVLEHLAYDEGKRLLSECRRCIKPESGAIRIIVPNAGELLRRCISSITPYIDASGILWTGDLDIDKFDGINPNSAAAPTACRKLWHLLMDGHASIWDQETLNLALTDAGWIPSDASFRETKVPAIQQIFKEGVELAYFAADGRTSSSLFMDAIPLTG